MRGRRQSARASCSVSGMERVVIVGAGTFGASLAWWLAGRGDEVVLVDQFEAGDRRGAAGGGGGPERAAPRAGFRHPRGGGGGGGPWGGGGGGGRGGGCR